MGRNSKVGLLKSLLKQTNGIKNVVRGFFGRAASGNGAVALAA